MFAHSVEGRIAKVEAQMKLARVHGAGDVRLDQVPVPVPGPDDVVVRVEACGICGSDLGFIAGGGLGGSEELNEPMPLGHELAGVIEFVGKDVTVFKPGDRVAVNPDDRLIGSGGTEGGMAPYLLVPAPNPNTTLFLLSDTVSTEEAALAEPLSVALHGIDLVGVTANDKVAIIGAGPIGLCAVAMLRHRGVRNIAIFDREQTRLDRALALGAHAAFNVAKVSIAEGLAQAHGEGTRFGARFSDTDVFIDAAGAAPALTDVFATAKYRARIAMIAIYKKPVAIDLFKLMANEIMITGSIADSRAREFGEALEMIASREFDLSALISHRYQFEDLHAALAMAANSAKAAKVMLRF